MPLFRSHEGDRRTVGRVLVATDRSETAEHAVRWAAEMAERYEAELFLLQVVVPPTQPTLMMTEDLVRHAHDLAGERGRGSVVVGEDPSQAIIEAAEREDADVVVVGNVGMSGRKEFLLGNVPNRVSHGTSRTVVIVNTMQHAEERSRKRGFFR
jgi:ubiquinone biosynthesis protein